MKTSENFLEKTAILFLIISGALGFVVAILDLIGTDLNTGPWRWLKDPQDINLLIVASLAMGLGIERYVRLKKDLTFEAIIQGLGELADVQQKSARSIIESLNGVKIHRFDDEVEHIRYMNKRISQARIRVDDLSWGVSYVQPYRFEKLSQAFNEYMQRVEKVAARIPYREIFIFDRQSRRNRFYERISQNTQGYSCAYFENSKIPLLEFMVIDQIEVLIWSNKLNKYFSIQHPLIAGFFTEYYEELWDEAKKLKHGAVYNWDEITKVLDQDEVQKLKSSLF